MFSDTYKDISPEIKEVLQSLVSESDEYHFGHTRRIARTLQVLVDQKPEGTLLEIGTEGLFPLAIQELLPDISVFVTTFEEQPSDKFSVEMNGYSGEFNNMTLNLEHDAIDMPSHSFDWVICCEVLEHMDIDPMFMLSEVNRVTKYDGNLLLTTPNIVSSRGLTKMLNGVEPYFFMQYHKDRSPYRHNYEYSVHSLVKVLQAAGFDGKIWTEDTFEDPIEETIDRLSRAGFHIKNTGDNIFVVAKKIGDVGDRYPRVIYV